MVIWTKELDNLVRRYYPSGDIDALAQRIGTTRTAVITRAKILRSHRKVNKHYPWTKGQIAYLKNCYAEMTIDLLVTLTGHSKNSIRAKATQLGLRKSSQFMNTPRPYNRKARESLI